MIQDLRYAFRQMLAHRGFAFTVVVTLALSIGSATAVFGIFDAVLLRPFPFPDPQSLVRLHTFEPNVKGSTRGSSIYDFADYEKQNTSFTGMAEFDSTLNNLTGRGPARVVTLTFTSAGLFGVLGAQPILGRTFSTDEDRIDGSARLAVLSYGIWRDLFALQPDAIGKTVQLRGESYTVIGVMPEGFSYPSGTDVWAPLMARYASYKEDFWKHRDHRVHDMLARLRPGVDIRRAQADMSIIAANLGTQYSVDKNVRLEVIPLREAEAGVLRPYVIVVSVAVLLLLMIGCVNVAGLFVARAAERERELTIRMAIGMSRSRLFRQLVSESLLHSVLGCACGVVAAIAGLRMLERAIPVQLPPWMRFEIDWRVLAFSIGVSLLTAVAFGLVPLWQQNEHDLNGALKHGAKGSTGTSSVARKMRSALLIAEVAMSVMLLAGAGLMLRSFANLLHVNTGVRTRHIFVANLHRFIPNATKQQELSGYADQHRLIAQRLLSLPGVQAVSGSDDLPFVQQPEERQAAAVYTPQRSTRELAYRGPAQGGDVMPGYFSMLGIPLLEGRDFNDADTLGSQPVIILSKRAADTLFPGQDALGRTVRWGGDTIWATVIGVVGDTKWNPAERNPAIEAYWSYRQWSSASMFIVVQSSLPGMTLAPEVRRIVTQANPEIAVDLLKEYDVIALESMWQRRLWSFVLSAFAGLAVLLTVVGLYGVLSYTVNQQTRDFGIRLAVGARRSDVFGLVMRIGLRTVAVGGALGLAAALLGTRLLRSVLFGVSTADIATYIGIVTLMLLAGALACALPALRATRIDPLEALKD